MQELHQHERQAMGVVHSQVGPVSHQPQSKPEHLGSNQSVLLKLGLHDRLRCRSAHSKAKEAE
eukprot:12819625-Prorocentrum_lima.AAC.1